MIITISRNRRDGFLGLTVLAGALGLGSGIMGASENKKAQKKQAAITEQTNQRNLEEFNRSRGATGSSILPLYFAQGFTRDELDALPEGALSMLATQYGINPDNLDANTLREQIVKSSSVPFEQQLARNIQQNILLQGSPGQQVADLQRVQEFLSPSQTQAVDLVNQIFDGRLTQEELSNLEPLMAERLNTAGVQSQAEDQALRQMLNGIRASRQESGFGGDSFASNLLNLNARQGTATRKSQNTALAKLQNAVDQLTVRNQGIQRRLDNRNAPAQAIAGQAAFNAAPTTATSANQQQVMAPLDFFRIAPQAFNYNAPNAVQGQLGSTILGGLSAGLTGYNTAKASDDFLNILKNQQSTPTA